MDDEEKDLFEWAKAPTALRDAVTQLCADAGVPITDLERHPLAEIFVVAQETYGPDLPEFWRVWRDWQDDQTQPMGEL